VLHRVQEENMAILTRITRANPHYPRNKQAKDWKQATRRRRLRSNHAAPILRPLQHPAPFRVSIPREPDEMQDMMHDFMLEQAGTLPRGTLPALEQQFGASDSLLADGLGGSIRPHPPPQPMMRPHPPPQRWRQQR
jgi:hypothetical protein